MNKNFTQPFFSQTAKSVFIPLLFIFFANTSSAQCDAHWSSYAGANADSIHFYPTGSAASFYYWNFGDGTTSYSQYPWHYYTAPGTYNVCLTINDSGTYCYWCDSITIAPPAVNCNAVFSSYSISNPDSVHFYPTGTLSANNYWTFGDGTNSTQQYPWHEYAGPGTYQVCHTINISGTYCTSCDSITIVGLVNCDASFVHYYISSPDSLHFFPTGTSATGYYWNFGDGTSASLMNPWHEYSAPGTYTVCLTIYSNGAYCTSCDTVVVPGIPCNAQFSFYPYSANPDSIHFYSSNTSATGYYWSFGDGTNSTSPYPWHYYTAPGTYNVCLTVNDSGTYCTSCDSVTIVSAIQCDASFYNYPLAGNPDSIHFYPTGTLSANNYWNFGDGTNSTQQYPWHEYANAGTYYVCHSINISGVYCTSCDSVTVSGATPCSAQFSHYSINNPDSIHFYPTGTSASFYYWSFGDGSTSTQQYPWHYYSSPGTYNVCLTINISGTYCTWCTDVVVTGAVVCNTHFSHYALSNPDSVHFYPTGTAGTSYYWSFGDGATSTSQYPWHEFAAAGTYSVCLTTNYGANSCTWCDSVTVTGASLPCNASFAHYSISNPDSVHFYPTGSTNAMHYWSFGDGFTSTQTYPWHMYAGPGTYYVCHSISVGGAYCTTCDSVTVTGPPSYYNIAPPTGSEFDFFPETGNFIVTLQNERIHIYPNPSSDIAMLSLSDFSLPVSFRVYDLTGRMILQKNNLGNGVYNISTKDFNDGVYFFMLVRDAQLLTEGKLMVIHSK